MTNSEHWAYITSDEYNDGQAMAAEAMAKAATPPHELKRQLMSSLVPKSEREHFAARLIDRLEGENMTMVDLLRDALSVIKTVVGEDINEDQQLSVLQARIENAIDRNVEEASKINGRDAGGDSRWQSGSYLAAHPTRRMKMSHYITCAKCFEPTMDVANLTCSECGYESGMSENKALRELTEQQAERIKELERENAEFRNQLVELDHCRDIASKAEQYERERAQQAEAINTLKTENECLSASCRAATEQCEQQAERIKELEAERDGFWDGYFL